jgi:hypothetical protein
MKTTRPHRSLAVAALPLAFAGGVLVARLWPEGAAVARVSWVPSLHQGEPALCVDADPLAEDAAGAGNIYDYETFDCWARWSDGRVMVQPGCTGEAWWTETWTRDHHLTILPLPDERAAFGIADALWGIPITDEPSDWMLADSLHVWLIAGPEAAADGGPDDPGYFRYATKMTPREALDAGIVDEEQARDAAAFVVAHLDVACERERVAIEPDGSVIWRVGNHEARQHPDGDWEWIAVMAPGRQACPTRACTPSTSPR